MPIYYTTREATGPDSHGDDEYELDFEYEDGEVTDLDVYFIDKNKHKIWLPNPDPIVLADFVEEILHNEDKWE